VSGDLDQLRMLVRYNAWANRTLFEAVAALPPDEPTRDRPSIFRSMVHTLNHLHVVDLVWQAHLEGREHGIPTLGTMVHPQLDGLWRAQAAIDAWYVAWADGLQASDLDGEVRFTLIGGNRGAMRKRDVGFHVVNHTSYHRGFVAQMFFDVPARPPLTDLPVYLREAAHD
jgi:uncharacterized damage-inducible protein DinB